MLEFIGMNRKIIFLDCDGTIIDATRNMFVPSDKTKYAISELLKNGHLVFISSGRCKCLIPKDIVDLNPSGFITTNGAYAYMGDKVLHNNPLKEESMNLIIDYCNSHNGIYFMEAQDSIYTKECDSKLFHDYVDRWNFDNSIFKTRKDNEDYHLMMTAFSSEEECERFYNELSSKLDLRRQYVFTSFDVGEFGVNKGIGVKKVLESLHIDRKDAYAFGDEMNDLEMLEAVEESFAMDNGNSKVKALCKNIAPDVTDDGFYQAMVWEGLIKPIV